MMLRRFKALAIFAVAALLVGVLAACGGDDETPATSTNGDDAPAMTEISIPIASGWDEDVAVSHLFKYVLEQNGYTVNLSDMDIGVAFAGIQKGDLDLFFDTWLPVTHESYWEEIGDDVEDLGVWYDEASLAIAVPEYLTDINTLADLKDNADLFNGTITGIDPAAGLTSVTGEAMEIYGLDAYDLKTSSTAAMLAALKKATDAEEPIVVTLWHPHWAYAAFPIKDLEDPEGAMGGTEDIHSIARKGFSEDFPEVAEAVKKFSMTDDELALLEDLVLQQHANDPEAGVKEWLDAHPTFAADLGLE